MTASADHRWLPRTLRSCISLQVLIFRLLMVFTKGNATLARRPVLMAALRDGKKILQVFEVEQLSACISACRAASLFE